MAFHTLACDRTAADIVELLKLTVHKTPTLAQGFSSDWKAVLGSKTDPLLDLQVLGWVRRQSRCNVHSGHPVLVELRHGSLNDF